MNNENLNNGPSSLAALAVKTVVFYHRDADGFASAFAAWCALGSEGVRYESVQYNEPVPMVPDGARVFVVDFSYARRVLMEWVGRGCQVVVLDHHKTAEEELRDLVTPEWRAALQGSPEAAGRSLWVIFDLARAGCEIAWEFFGALAATSAQRLPQASLLARPFPWLLQAVADRDLWKFEHPQTREICARLDLEPWDFERWWEMAACFPQGGMTAQQFVQEGTVLVRYKESLAEWQVKPWFWIMLKGPGGAEIAVPIVNCTAITSETAKALFAKVRADVKRTTGRDRAVEVVACYERVLEGYRVSLRGSGEIDVSAIAKEYGGGGHKSAAGFFWGEPMEGFTRRGGDAESAQSTTEDTEKERLKAEVVSLRQKVYMPGNWKCEKCKFEQVNRVLHAHSGAISAPALEEVQICPNDGEAMRKVTWEECSQSNYEACCRFLDEREALQKKVEQLVKELALADHANQTMMDQVRSLGGGGMA